MTIRVLSFDFDGCLFNMRYIHSREKDVIESNAVFFAQIQAENALFTQITTFVGSNRQSFSIDNLNSPHKGSCFPAVKKVSDHLVASLDPFLLADVYGDLPDGTSYERAMTELGDEHSEGIEEHAEWLFDETKATILYAQMHKIANENPTEKIMFDFYDDRGNRARAMRDILEQLRDFYTKYPELIPQNVTLRLHQYAGAGITAMATIEGTGFIDSNYKQTVKDMAAIATTVFNDGVNNPIYVSENVEPCMLTNRKALLISARAPVEEVKAPQEVEEVKKVALSQTAVITTLDSTEIKRAKDRFEAALQAIQTKANLLQKKADEFYVKGLDEKKREADFYSYSAAALAARALHDTLKTASEQFFADGDREEFKGIALDAINNARESELKNHRGWKEVLSYTGFAVLALLSLATLGLAYAVVGGVNYAVNGNFFFSPTINTDSIKKVNDLESTIHSIAAPAA